MRKLVFFTIGFGAACLLGSFLWNVGWALIPGLALLAVSVFGAVHWKKDELKALSVGCLGLVLGLLWFIGWDAVYTQPVRQLDGTTVNARLVSYDYSWETDYGSAVDCYWNLDGKQYRVRLYLNEKLEVEPWTVIECPVRVQLTTDGGQKEPTFHRSNGILALCYQQESATFSVEDESKVGRLVIGLADLRRSLENILDVSFDVETAGFAKALLLGNRVDLDYETETAFKVSGISHIVAVSGLHMSILFALVYVLTLKRRWLLALVGAPLLVLFMALVGFTPSVTRAGIMQLLMIGALCLNREYDPPSALSGAALLMLLANPLVASGVGFQLSVASVAGIFLFMDPISKWLGGRIPEGKKKWLRRMRSWLIFGVSVSLSAQVLTIPLVALYYGTVSLVSVVTNLAVLWMISLVFYGAMAVCLAGAFSRGVASVLAIPVSWVMKLILGIAKVIAQLPLAAVYTESVYITIWLVVCYGLIVTVMVGWNKQIGKSVLLGALGLCVALGICWMEPLFYDHSVTVLDVGQGQSVILQHRGKTFVVDCGGDYEDDAADKCAEKLLSMGIRRIDGLIVSHMDADHCGGAEELMERIRVDALYLPEGSALNGAQNLFYVVNDMILETEGMKLTLFAPQFQGNDNESSIAVLFQTEKCDTLIVNDMSALGEQLLVKRQVLPELELLVVGHHGSKNSTSMELLEATTPECAFISVGKNNRYSHPSKEVLERLGLVGCQVHRTDESGNLCFRR